MFNFIREENPDTKVEIDEIDKLEYVIGKELPDILRFYYRKHNGDKIVQCAFKSSGFSYCVTQIYPITEGKRTVQQLMKRNARFREISYKYVPIARDKDGDDFYWNIENDWVYYISIEAPDSKIPVAKNVEEFFQFMNESNPDLPYYKYDDDNEEEDDDKKEISDKLPFDGWDAFLVTEHFLATQLYYLDFMAIAVFVALAISSFILPDSGKITMLDAIVKLLMVGDIAALVLRRIWIYDKKFQHKEAIMLITTVIYLVVVVCFLVDMGKGTETVQIYNVTYTHHDNGPIVGNNCKLKGKDVYGRMHYFEISERDYIELGEKDLLEVTYYKQTDRVVDMQVVGEAAVIDIEL